MDRARARPKFGPFELHERLGIGGMAEVVLATRGGPHGFAKRVALKRILPEHAQHSGYRSMFVDEARISALLNHPNIVQVVDFGEHEGELYLALEHVDGLSCSKILRHGATRNQAFPAAAALYVIDQVLRALEFAHEACDEHGNALRIVHRDVSPGNVLIGKTGDVKLTDFGIVRSELLPDRTTPGEIKGKLGYLSPEQVMGAPVDRRSDLFAVGIVLTEMLLARALFPGHDEFDLVQKIFQCDLSVLDKREADIPEPIRPVLRRALQREREDRYQTAGEFIDGVRRAGAALRAPIDERALLPWLSDLGVMQFASGTRNAVPSPLPFSMPEVRKPTSSSPRAPVDAARRASVSHDAPRPLVAPSSRAPKLKLVAAREEDGRATLVDARRDPADQWFIRCADGSVAGPWARPRMLELIATARISGRTLVSEDGTSFQAVDRIPELADLSRRKPFRYAEPSDDRSTWKRPLSRAGLPSILFDLVIGMRTGLLTARCGRRQKRIYFVQGTPSFSASTDREELLGPRLVGSGLVSSERVDRAIEEGNGGRLGETLVRSGGLRPMPAILALAAQLEARLLDLGSWIGGELVWFDGEQSGEPAVLPRSSAGELVTRLVREHYSDADIATILGPVRYCPIRRGTRKVEIRTLGFRDGERKVLERAATVISVEELVVRIGQEAGIPANEALRAIFLGASAGALTIVGWGPGGGIEADTLIRPERTQQ